MDFARILRGFCMGFARNLILFLFEREHEGYKRFADCTVYGHGGHLGHVTLTIYINFRSPFQRRLHIIFGFDWPSGFRGEDI